MLIYVTKCDHERQFVLMRHSERLWSTEHNRTLLWLPEREKVTKRAIVFIYYMNIHLIVHSFTHFFFQ